MLSGYLKDGGIGYVHRKGLGGLCNSAKNSSNTGWRSPSFRGFADHMETEAFQENLQRLMVKDRVARGTTQEMSRKGMETFGFRFSLFPSSERTGPFY
jgi:Domain of unknown function DUF488